jgi:hypothetical protein
MHYCFIICYIILACWLSHHRYVARIRVPITGALLPGSWFILGSGFCGTQGHVLLMTLDDCGSSSVFSLLVYAHISLHCGLMWRHHPNSSHVVHKSGGRLLVSDVSVTFLISMFLILCHVTLLPPQGYSLRKTYVLTASSHAKKVPPCYVCDHPRERRHNSKLYAALLLKICT